MIHWYYPFSALFILGTSLLIGLFVICKDYKAKANQGFFLFAFSVSFWSFGYFFWQLSKTQPEAIFWCRVLTAGGIWITVWSYYFVIKVLNINETKYKIIFFTGVIAAVVFSVFNLTTKLLVSSTRPTIAHAYWPVPGPLYLPYLLMFLFFSIFSTVILFQEYRKAGGFKRNQIRWVFLGNAIGYAGGCTNYPLWYGINIPPIGNILVGLYPIFFGYAIVKYRFFEIDTVIHRTALWLVTSLWLMVPAYIFFRVVGPWISNLSAIWLTVVALGLFYLFLWYYRYLQPKIDHFFRRRKYDYYEVLDGLGSKIGSELELDSIVGRLFRELQEILYIRNGLLLVREGSSYQEAGKTGCESTTEIEKEASQLSAESVLARWLEQEQKVLEKEQVEGDPRYEKIKRETLEWYQRNRIEVLIPIVLADKVNGILGLGKKENLQAYSLKDLELLEKLGQQIGIVIDNALHHEDIVEKGRLAEEMKLGQEIQKNLLPKTVPEVQGLHLAGLMVPAREIGGDYYDYITTVASSQSLVSSKEEGQSITDQRPAISTQKLSIVIGDVSGKGVAAGLIMATAKATLKGLAGQGLSPRQMLTKANSLLHEYTKGEKFMTMLYLTWDNQHKQLNYSSAGHEHIIIYRSGKGVRENSDTVISDKVIKPAENTTTIPLYHSTTGSVEVIQSGGFVLGMLP
ncbi:MAG: SpoIIE family protein phosphatase, partial [Elusimicrobia bacterium]|nr:SpoIIE family protein phosphatase [Elusimicrobiota bacterium]